MTEEVVRFVPRYTWKGYNCSIELLRFGTTKQECRVFLRPAPGKGFLVEEDLSILLGMLDPKPLPLWLATEGVRIQRVIVPEEEIVISRDHKILSFAETIEFFAKFKTMKMV